MRRTRDEVPESTRVTDEELVSAVAAGDESALGQLYDRYASAIFGLTLRIAGQREVAEELTQEAFLRVWRKASSFQATRGAFAPWLFGIAHNLAIDEIRRGKARPQPVYDSEERPIFATISDESTSVEDAAWLSEQRGLIQQALDELPGEQREVLTLAYYGGLTQREIAERLGSPLGTVKTRARLGLMKLRELLGGSALNLEDDREL